MPENSVIINIGRQLGANASQIAKRLAKDFNCAYYDKALLDLAAKESGFSRKFFAECDECNAHFHTGLHAVLPFLGDNSFYGNKFSQENLFLFQSEAIKKAAHEGNCVFVGRCADYVLRDFPNKVNVFITANLKDRIRQIMERNSCNEDTAKKIIQSVENKRIAYYNFYTGKKWGVASSYDLCINSSLMGVEKSAQYITQFIRQALDI